MHGPEAAGWPLVVLCAVTGAYCLLRRQSRGEALMGFGMAAMAVPAAVLSPPRWMWAGYVVVFGGTALHALWRGAAGGWRSGHHTHHTVGSLAMAYLAHTMAATPSGMHGTHSAHSLGLPLLTGALFAYYAVYVLHAGVRLMPAPAGAGGSGATSRWPEPELLPVCRLSMGIAMITMLLTA